MESINSIRTNLRKHNTHSSSYKIIKDFAIATTACFVMKNTNPITAFEILQEKFPSESRKIIYDHIVAYSYMEQEKLLGKMLYPGELVRINPLYYLLVPKMDFDKIFYTTSDTLFPSLKENAVHECDFYNIEQIVELGEEKFIFDLNDGVFSEAFSLVSDKAKTHFKKDYEKILSNEEKRFIQTDENINIWNLYGSLRSSINGIKDTYYKGQITSLLSLENRLGQNSDKTGKYSFWLNSKSGSVISKKDISEIFSKIMLNIGAKNSRDDFLENPQNFGDKDLVKINDSFIKLLTIEREIYKRVMDKNFLPFKDERSMEARAVEPNKKRTK